uniref:Uncharacterized protein n=1 Tax=Bactrocera latifrons TaxID=174628 RepID=A0A0K8VFP7_BACLA
MYDIILKAIYEEKMGKTTGPTVPILKKFQTAWSGINVNNFKTGIEHEKVKENFNPVDVSRILDFEQDALQEQHPREDYREFLELTAIFLGTTPPRGVIFRVPGAIHHARWMARFRDEFKLSPHEENAICDICIFLIRVYVEAWFCAPSAAKAPYLHFSVLSTLYKYQNIDSDISRVALQKIKNHLWYLSPEPIALPFFDSNLSSESKRKMVSALYREADISEENTKKINVQINQIPEIMNNGIKQFVSNKTRKFFTRFDISDEFLNIDPSQWHKNEDFINALNLVKKLKVVNDPSERGVKLMEDYNNLFTKNEEQKKYVLQVVNEYRQKFPDSRKQTLSMNKDF